MKVALVGYGYWGKIIRKYIDTSVLLELICIYDLYEEGEIFVKSLDEIWKNKEISSVFICTPIQTHFQLCKQALEHKKNVFCEKPLVSTIKELDELQELAFQNKRVLYTDYIYTVSPSINKIKEYINQIGKIKYIKGEITQWGKFYPEDSVFEVLGVHLMSALAHILELKSEFEEVKYTEILNDIRGNCISGKITLRAKGIQSDIWCNLGDSLRTRRLLFIGSKGTIRFDMLNKPNVQMIKFKLEEVGCNSLTKEEIINDEFNNLENAINQFIEFIQLNNNISNSIIARIITQALEDGIYERV